MKCKFLIVILAVVAALACTFGITACKEKTPDNSGNGQGNVQIPPEEKPDDTEKPTIVEVTGVNLNKTTLSLEVGDEETLTATVAPDNATDKTVTWKSSDSSVAKVENGKVTALKAGTTTITATAGGKSATCTVTVKENVIPHTHRLTLVPAKEADCETAGNTAYYACDCGKWFSDADAKTEITDKSSVTINATGHSYSDEWTFDETQHWHAATCKHTALTDAAQKHNLVNNVCTVCGYETETAGLIYVQYRTGYAVTGYEGSATKVVVPAKHDGKPVLAIGTGVGDGFAFCSNVTEIILPDTIQQIQAEAFSYCAKFTKITIPSCLSIGNRAFANCAALQEIILPENCLTYGSNIFENCNSLKKVTIKSGVIGDYVFNGCSSVTDIEFGSEVTSISKNIFDDCTNLTNLVMANVECIDFKLSELGKEAVTVMVNGSYFEPEKVDMHTVGNITFGVPATGTAWYLSANTVDVNGKTAYYTGNAVEVVSWTTVSRYGYSWKEPISAKVKCYYATGTLEKITITEQQLSLKDERLVGAPCEIEVLNRFPVNQIEVVGQNEAFIDEFDLADYKLSVTRTSGEVDKIDFKQDYLSQTDLNKLKTVGNHTVAVTVDGFKYEWDISIKNHEFENIVFESQYFFYDGTVKSLQVVGVPEGTTVNYSNNNKSAIGEYTVTAIISKQFYDTKTLTATLSIKKLDYKIVYELGLDGVKNLNPETYNALNGLTLVAPERGGWEFLGWYTDSGFSNKITKIDVGTAEDKTLYAKWQTVFTLNGGTITGLTAYGKTCTEIIIDTVIDDVRITGIGSSAFKDCSVLTSVTIPDSVTSIGYAFWDCERLKNIYYEGDMSKWCKISGLGYLMTFGRTLYIDGKEVAGDLVIPDSVKSIGDSAFCGCSGLTSVTIPDSVISIGSSAFYNCNGLTSITIPDSVKDINQYAFYRCSGLTNITIPDSVTSIGSSAFRDCSGLTSVTIPNSVKDINQYAFYRCSGLTNITIPDSVTTIGGSAFEGCSGLTSITIPDGVTTIGGSAFSGCSGVTEVFWNAENCTEAGSASFPIFNGCTKITTVIIGENVKNVPAYAFCNCSGAISVTIGNGLKSIGEYAFHGTAYYNDKNNWQNGVLYVGKYLIKAESSLSGEYSTKQDTLLIAVGAFSACSGLTSVTIGNDVTSIGNSAFKGCSDLTQVYWNAENCTKAGDNNYPIFNGCAKLTSATIGENVKNIPAYAFYNCSGLTSITIPDSVTSIGGYAFRGCSGLTSLVIPDSVTSIGGYAFIGCTSLTSLVIPDSVTSIGGYAFSVCSGLTSVTIGNGVTSLDYNEFNGCTSLTSVTIGNGVTNIGYYAFCGCSGLTSLAIPDSVMSIGGYAFRGCSGLTSVTIPDSVTTIGSSAFDGCSGLTEINYGGTKEQWNSVGKGSYWNNGTGNYTIHCTDGDIAKS